jgi:5-formyltetrahydrofolate cyclo-ligase
MADQKHRLRKVMRKCRTILPSEQALVFSRSIQTRAIALQCYRSAAAVLLYAAVDNEVATTLILEHALAAGRRVFYPVAGVATGSLDFRAVDSAADLRPGRFAIPEPLTGRPIEPGELRGAVIFVPGLAFGVRGERLGMGGGYYDRFLTSAGPEVTAVGLGYSFQLVERLPQDPWDRRLDYVVTELALFEPRRPRPDGHDGLEKGGVSR